MLGASLFISYHNHLFNSEFNHTNSTNRDTRVKKKQLVARDVSLSLLSMCSGVLAKFIFAVLLCSQVNLLW